VSGSGLGIKVAVLCTRLGMSRQNYYACERRRQRRVVDRDLVIELVNKERKVQPMIGTRKLMHMLGSEFEESGLKMGRDRMFDILREEDMLVTYRRTNVRTTNSRHSLPVFMNLIKDREATMPNQIWVSDLTYIRTDEGFMFAALITDIVSRKIVGYHISDSLESKGCLAALGMALKQLPSNRFPIHHSDRGCQYCCHEYVGQLMSRGLSVSMTEQNHCYENGLAERVNGILKTEYGLGSVYRTKEQSKRAFTQAVMVYNHRRPHLSLNYKTPSEVHEKVA
jgi:transposase InsO family protein